MPLLIVIVVLVIGGGIYYYSRGSSKPISYLKADLTNTYTVLANENLWRTKLIASENPEAWLVSTKNITVKAIDYQGNFSCGDKKAEFIKYSSFNTGAVGGWGSVSVVDCGSYYFIFDYGDAGPKLFGPFELNGNSQGLNQNNISTTTIMQGVSMQPTYKAGTILKISRDVSDIKRNQVIVYNHVSNPNADFIKRVVGLPNETVSISGGKLYINGTQMNIPNISTIKGPNLAQITLGNDQYFVLGDNTEQSFDSRAGGPILRKDVTGIITGSI